jgi:hypothetical protein
VCVCVCVVSERMSAGLRSWLGCSYVSTYVCLALSLSLCVCVCAHAPIHVCKLVSMYVKVPIVSTFVCILRVQ